MSVAPTPYIIETSEGLMRFHAVRQFAPPAAHPDARRAPVPQPKD